MHLINVREHLINVREHLINRVGKAMSVASLMPDTTLIGLVRQ